MPGNTFFTDLPVQMLPDEKLHGLAVAKLVIPEPVSHHLFILTDAYEALLTNAFTRYKTVNEEYGSDDVRKATYLIRSRVWRQRYFTSEIPLIVTGTKSKEIVQEFFRDRPLNNPIEILSFKDFVMEARTLTPIKQADETLKNIYDQFFSTGSEIKCEYITIRNPGGDRYAPSYRNNLKEGTIEDGRTYGSNEAFGAFIWKYLIDKEYIEIFQNGIHLTAKGIDRVAELRRNEGTLPNKVFLVRRYSKELDPMLLGVAEILKRDFDVTMNPIWAEEHNERIDEKIFNDIREAFAVVVDISPVEPKEGDRINVGIELGYALGLGKEIVLICRDPNMETDFPFQKRRPFDISTIDCKDYPWDATHENIIKLASRIMQTIKYAQNKHRRKLI